MVVTNSAVLGLDVEQRNRLEGLLVDFERSWHEGCLAEKAAALPQDGPLRRGGLVEMVKIDLERNWQNGRTPTGRRPAAACPLPGSRAFGYIDRQTLTRDVVAATFQKLGECETFQPGAGAASTIMPREGIRADARTEGTPTTRTRPVRRRSPTGEI